MSTTVPGWRRRTHHATHLGIWAGRLDAQLDVVRFAAFHHHNSLA